MKASPQNPGGHWNPGITFKMVRFYAEDNEFHSVDSDFSIILLIFIILVDIATTKCGDLVIPTSAL